MISFLLESIVDLRRSSFPADSEGSLFAGSGFKIKRILGHPDGGAGNTEKWDKTDDKPVISVFNLLRQLSSIFIFNWFPASIIYYRQGMQAALSLDSSPYGAYYLEKITAVIGIG